MTDQERAERRARGLERAELNLTVAHAVQQTKARHKEVGGRYMRDLGLKIIHFRLATIVWRFKPTFLSHRRQNIIQISTALLHKNDHYNKSEGRYYASENFSNGRFIELRIPKGRTPQQFLYLLFSTWL